MMMEQLRVQQKDGKRWLKTHTAFSTDGKCRQALKKMEHSMATVAATLEPVIYSLTMRAMKYSNELTNLYIRLLCG